MTNENLITPPSRNFLSRLGRGLKYAFRGDIPNQALGAGNYLQPVFQDIKGRQFDYQIGQNYQITPRQDEDIDFNGLRTLSYNCDILRAVIELRKDEVLRLNWNIAKKNGSAAGYKTKKIQEFFLYPDKEHSWNEWLRMILEDIFVIDAACIYPRFTRGGDVYSLELIDGAMIKKIIQNDGRTPMPPLPAYQQIVHGIQSVNYTADELLYLMKNPRTSKLYGYSTVEQIKTVINIAINKQASQLEYYTAGSIPDMIVSVDQFSVDQIKEFQKYWDELLSGDLRQRRRVRFIPAMKDIKQTKEAILKDEFDEWLARTVCFAFSTSATPFIKNNNRATAEVVEESSQIRGLVPLMKWIKNFIDLIIIKYFDESDIEFVWQEDKEADPLIMAQIHDIYLKNGVMQINEVRESLGMTDIPPEVAAADIQTEAQAKSTTSESAERLGL
jgi:hypothetical protein